jgi:hypothetical protein
MIDFDIAMLNATVSDKRCWCEGRVEYRVLSPESRPVVVCSESNVHVWDSTGRLGKTTKLYIAGPMSGYPGANYPAFNTAELLLRRAGYETVNPAKVNTGTEAHYVDFIREDIRVMLDCHGVAVLEFWWESPGARNEVSTMGLMKRPIRSVDEWLIRAEQETHNGHQ